MVMEEVEPEIDECTRNRLPALQQVLFVKVPASRPNDQDSRLVGESVGLALGSCEIDLPANCIAQVRLPSDHVVPRGRQRILAIRHEHPRTGIQRVDDHLAIGRPRDLDPSVSQVSRDRRHSPVALANRACLRQKIGQLARVEPLLALLSRLEQLLHPRRKTLSELLKKRQGLGRQDSFFLRSRWRPCCEFHGGHHSLLSALAVEL